MKKRLFFVCFCIALVLVTSMMPLCVFAEDAPSTFSISGYISVSRGTLPVLFQTISIPEGFVDRFKENVKVEVKGTNLSAVTDASGYFKIDNVPEKATGYILKCSATHLFSEEFTINTFTDDVVYPQSSPVNMRVNWDLNEDGSIGMADVMIVASYFNTLVKNYKISGYISIKEDFPGGVFKGLAASDLLPREFLDEFKKDIKVEVKGTSLSAISDADGYFEINNVPEKETGYTLKFGGRFLLEKEVVITSFTQDVIYPKTSPTVMEVDWDQNDDGTVNMADIMVFASRFDKVYTSYKISGYITPDFEFPDSWSAALREKFKVEVVGKELLHTEYTDENGFFDIQFANTSETGYTLKISKANYLYREVKTGKISSDMEISSKDKPLVMYVGDVNADNVVNMLDVMLVAGAFNTKSGDEKYVQNLDLNIDGAINFADILIIAHNFNKLAPVL